jgi:hypothetical protein
LQPAPELAQAARFFASVAANIAQVAARYAAFAAYFRPRRFSICFACRQHCFASRRTLRCFLQTLLRRLPVLLHVPQTIASRAAHFAVNRVKNASSAANFCANLCHFVIILRKFSGSLHKFSGSLR